MNVQVNDLTIDTVRQEFTDLETCGKLPVLQICPARSDIKKLTIVNGLPVSKSLTSILSVQLKRVDSQSFNGLTLKM
jgi:hypothetical protein